MPVSRAADHPLAPYRDRTTLQRIADVEADTWAPAVGDEPGVSVVILNLDRPDLIVPLLRTLVAGMSDFAARGLGLQVIVGDTGSTDPEVLACYADLAGAITVVEGLSYHFSANNNTCVNGRVMHDHIFFCNNDVILPDVGPLLALYDAVDAPGVGIAGLALDLPDGRVQHLGLDVFRSGDLKGLCYHPGAEGPAVHNPGATWPAVAVTGAALMIRSELFARLGGFDEHYRAEAQDVDLCLAARRLGQEVVVVDAGEVVHIENATRRKGEENWPDRRLFIRRWGSYIEAVWP
ncbi:MAG: glycosyltransferase family 2 protein [Actinobacteria bacterium]|nr:glycosyltransferase family 2 protein [Actinomycetota bacterium]MCB9411306.1 glycosyltransferase family 2 protein [Actinomycetota bacterium]